MLMSKGQSGARGKWKVLLFAALFVPVLITLGFWQLHRADLKEQRLQAWEAAKEQPFLPASDFEDGVKVRLAGQFDPQMIFLLDNRTREGRVGYELLGVFRPEGELSSVLVNLGWVAADPDRRRLPVLAMPEGIVEIRGRLINPQPVIVLRKDVWESGWPKRIQQIDLARMTDYQAPLFGGVMKVSEPVIEDVIPGWPVVTMTPEKHLGYAVQWFGLALVLITGTVWFLRRGRPGRK